MSVADDFEPRDDGLAAERTDLAWNRSGLALVVCIAVLLRRLWPLDRTDQVVALAVMSAGTLVWAVALRLGRVVSGEVRARRGVLGAGAVSMISVGTLLLALAGFVLGIFPPST
jgi:uncharacterized membrane protein YidH (DUF202 family)